MKNINKEFSKFKSWLCEHRDNYASILAEKPYCIETAIDTVDGKNLVMFKYSQIESDFSLPFVKLCRGLILDVNTFDPVIFPFVKFHNYGEKYADEIDWKSCYVTDKIDGSIIKVALLPDGFLLVSTNGTIDAFKAPLAEQIGCTAKTFGDLFVEGIVDAFYDKIDWDGFGLPLLSDTVERECLDFFKSNLEVGKTYMFELTSPFNKIVVTWHEVKLHFIGFRDNITGEEMFFRDHPLSQFFHTPDVFSLKSIDECISAAEKLDCNAEGYVVVDKDFSRIKIKSPTYVALHHMKNNGVLSYERGVEIVRGNELDEVLTYFPEFRSHLEAIKVKYEEAVDGLKKMKDEIDHWTKENGYSDNHHLIENGGKDRKNLALWLKKTFKNPGIGFAIVDGKVTDPAEWLRTIPASKAVSFLGLKQS